MNKQSIINITVLILIILSTIAIITLFPPTTNHQNNKLTEITTTNSNQHGTITTYGKITPETMILQLTIDMTFPYNENMAALDTGYLWLNMPSSQVMDWVGIQNEQHTWTITITINQYNTTFEQKQDQNITKTITIEDGIIGISNNTYMIQGYLVSVDDQPPYENYMEIETPPYYLHKEQNDFWFTKL